jgi:hypothetical protein
MTTQPQTITRPAPVPVIDVPQGGDATMGTVYGKGFTAQVPGTKACIPGGIFKGKAAAQRNARQEQAWADRHQIDAGMAICEVTEGWVMYWTYRADKAEAH